MSSETLTVDEGGRGRMDALVIDGPRSVTLVSREIPVPGPNEVLIKTAYVGICGTDLHLFDGTMAYLARGYLSYPFVFGHEYSGVVDSVGAGVTEVRPGDRVAGHCMVPCGACTACQRGTRNICFNLREVGLRYMDGAAAEYVRVPARSVTVIPDELDLAAAAMVEPGVTAYRACVRAECGPRDRVAVLGTATMGLLSGMFAAERGAEVTVLGIEDSELRFADSLGVFYSVLHGDVARADDYDVVIETTGSRQGLQRAVEISAPRARISLIGMPGAESLIDQTAVVLKDISLFGILHGIDHYVDVVRAYSEGRVSPVPLIQARIAPEKVADLFAELSGGPASRKPKTLIEFSR